MKTPKLVSAVLVLCLGLSVPRDACAQLISPGKLSAPHAELEGLRNCTECHQLRQRGIAPDRCLACHQPLADRIAAATGLHRGEEYQACATCHLDHRGREAELVAWEPDTLDHRSVGFGLEEAHAFLGCRDCHRSPLVRDVAVRTWKGRYGSLGRTFLGLDATCVGCHGNDDPHDGAFEDQACSDCHDQTDWESASATFDHDRTRYPLTGRHRSVTCNECHSGPIGAGFAGLAFGNCTDCHDDPHAGAMAAACETCHTTADWNRVSRDAVEARFDHEAVYPLDGAHGIADCLACHAPQARADSTIRITYRGESGVAYPAPVADQCASCHVDLHRGELGTPPDGARCADCHGQASWYPSTFGISRHANETAFALAGAHLATPCVGCHGAPLGAGQFVTDGSSCGACHAESQPHGEQFAGRDCIECHGDETFRIDAFDHESTRYPLRGAHVAVPCGSCHQPFTNTTGVRIVRYRPIAFSRCGDCHS
jgi:hypothetical protein